MRIITGVAALRDALREPRRAGKRIGFVPTMGALHEGHLALVDASRAASDVTVMSIFVNPLQFGPSEDLAKYPRDADGDARQAKARGVDIIFMPSAEEMYPSGREMTVLPGATAQRWEGAARPGHFAGVLTVVAKLFNIVMPDVAVFGQKDFQQAALVRALIRDLNVPLELIVHPIVREPDGLALSSRNRYLDAADRKRALGLSRALRAIRAHHGKGERRAEPLIASGTAEIERENLSADYLAVVDAETLAPKSEVARGDAVIVAARVGITRLIDNTVLGADDPGLEK